MTTKSVCNLLFVLLAAVSSVQAYQPKVGVYREDTDGIVGPGGSLFSGFLHIGTFDPSANLSTNSPAVLASKFYPANLNARVNYDAFDDGSVAQSPVNVTAIGTPVRVTDSVFNGVIRTSFIGNSSEFGDATIPLAVSTYVTAYQAKKIYVWITDTSDPSLATVFSIFDSGVNFEFAGNVAFGSVANLSLSSATVRVRDNGLSIGPIPSEPAFARLTIAASQADAQEGGTATFTITRSERLSNAVSVDYSIAANPADVGTPSPSSPVAFAATETTKTLTVPLPDRAGFQGNRTFTVTISNPLPANGAELGPTTSATVTIVEDDPQQFGSFDLDMSAFPVSEAGGSVVVEVRRSAGSDGEVTVEYTTQNGTAVAPTDYTAQAGTLTFPAGNADAQMVTIPIADRAGFQGSRAFTFKILNAGGGAALGTTQEATITIADDEVAQNGSFQLNAAAFTVSETGASVAVTVQRTGGSDGAVTVQFTTEDGTATAPTDYTTRAGTLTFPAGNSTPQIVTIPVADRANFQGNRTFKFKILNPGGGAALGTPQEATITIEETSPPPVAGTIGFSATTFSGNEGSTVTITGVRANGSNGAVGATVNFTPGTASSPGDFAGASQSFSWADLEAGSKSITVTLPDNVNDEPNKTFTATLASPTGGAGLNSPSTATVTIVDNDTAGAIAFTRATETVNENAGPLVLDVVRQGGSDGAVNVTVSTTNGSATAGDDFTAPATPLAFANAQTTRQISIPIVNDGDFEGDRTFTVTISSPTNGGTLGAITTVTVTIDEDETASVGEFTIDPAAVEVNENAGTVTLQIKRGGGTDTAVGVTVSTANGTATAPGDYTTKTEALAFAQGEAQKPFTVTIANDDIFESNETFTVSLSNATNGSTIGSPSTATVTIKDNDTAGTFGFTSATATIGEAAGPLVLDVVRQDGSEGAVNLTVSTTNGSATAGDDFTAPATPLEFANAQTTAQISIPIVDDGEFEGDRTFTVTLSAPTNGGKLGAIVTVTVTIDEDETASAGEFTIDPASIEVNENAGTVTLQIKRGGGTDTEVAVTVSTAPGTATADSDYTTKTETLTFVAGEAQKPFTVSILDNEIFEVPETFTVSLSNATNGSTIGSPSAATVTIRDNDAPATFSLAEDSYEVTEGGTVAVTIVRGGGSAGVDLSVGYRTRNGSARSGADYTRTAGTATFAPGETSRTISIPTLVDTESEEEETFFFRLERANSSDITQRLVVPARASIRILRSPAGFDRPDLMVAVGGSSAFAGNGNPAVHLDATGNVSAPGQLVYNASGNGQIAVLNGKAGSKQRFTMRVQNDAPISDSIKLTGVGSGTATGSTAAFSRGGRNITPEMISIDGYVIAGMRPGQSVDITVEVTLKSGSAKLEGYGATVTAASVGTPANTDVSRVLVIVQP